MSSTAFGKIAQILGVDKVVLQDLDQVMQKSTGRGGVFDYIYGANEKALERALNTLGILKKDPVVIWQGLFDAVARHEKELFEVLNSSEGSNEFEKAASLARAVVQGDGGFFLRREYIREILEKRPPPNLLRYLGYDNIWDLLSKEDLTECFSALRFIETNEWMHETFEEVYSGFKPDDFEERSIEVRVLGPKWQEVARKFVEKKHHNVSHLKEFGVIFINPIKTEIEGKMLRDFALLLHYFHEIHFYSEIFKKYFSKVDFSEHFKSVLRGDVKEPETVNKGDWLIVQRYLVKEDPNDPRLLLPRVNPESLHWGRGEKDLARFAQKRENTGMELWMDLDWVGEIFDGELVSFDLEDNAMSLVSRNEGRNELFTYHQKEALWTKIFSEYVGGELEMEKIIIDNFDQGIIRYSS